MPINLLPPDAPSARYELTHPTGAAFTMAEWTMGMQEEIDKHCFQLDPGTGKYRWNVAKEREIKLSLAVVDWKGVMMDGVDAPCTIENKMRLPVGVIFWLINEIDERSGLRMTPEQKKTLS